MFDYVYVPGIKVNSIFNVHILQQMQSSIVTEYLQLGWEIPLDNFCA